MIKENDIGKQTISDFNYPLPLVWNWMKNLKPLEKCEKIEKRSWKIFFL